MLDKRPKDGKSPVDLGSSGLAPRSKARSPLLLVASGGPDQNTTVSVWALRTSELDLNNSEGCDYVGLSDAVEQAGKLVIPVGYNATHV